MARRRTVHVRIEEAGASLGYDPAEMTAKVNEHYQTTLLTWEDRAMGAHHDAGECPYGSNHDLSNSEGVLLCADKYVASMVFETTELPKPRMSVRIVADEQCPECGRNGSPKVCSADGVWSWKCPSTREQCSVGYWVPGTDDVEYKPSEEEAQEMYARIKREVEAQVAEHGIQVTTYHADGSVTDDSIAPKSVLA